MGSVGEFLFGREPEVEPIKPEQIYMKPTEEEQRLLRGLMGDAEQARRRRNEFQKSLQRFLQLGQQQFGQMFQPAINELQNIQRMGKFTVAPALNEAVALKNVALGELGTSLQALGEIRQGRLPLPFLANIRSQFEQEVGQAINQLANRGILNSSIAQRALTDAVNRAMERQVQFLPVASQLAIQPFQVASQGAQMPLQLGAGALGLLRQQIPFVTTPFQFATSQPVQFGLLFNRLAQQEQRLPFDIWRAMLLARAGMRGDVAVKEGSGGIIGGFFQGLGQGLGRGIGGAIGGG